MNGKSVSVIFCLCECVRYTESERIMQGRMQKKKIIIGYKKNRKRVKWGHRKTRPWAAIYPDTGVMRRRL